MLSTSCYCTIVYIKGDKHLVHHVNPLVCLKEAEALAISSEPSPLTAVSSSCIVSSVVWEVGSLEICRSRDAATAEKGVRLVLGWGWGWGRGTETENSLVAMSMVWVSWASRKGGDERGYKEKN
ncbi:hypothetical protein L6452_35682 [Arctium lappa]|uniref:Uncharacterized protein n=1 Tax=Arctium lappa TaxID=4217 RepID=A0ACB8YBB0_ARCLA|nr:hypothetical protein L6452_35682 [Arctium lappa]